MHQYRYLYRNRISVCFCIFLRNVNSKLLFRASPNPFSDKEIFIIFESFRVKFQSLNTRENIMWSTISDVIMVWSWFIVKTILIWQIRTSDFLDFSKFNRARLWPTGMIMWSNGSNKNSQIFAEISTEF